jgi:hypothetical protein
MMIAFLLIKNRFMLEIKLLLLDYSINFFWISFDLLLPLLHLHKIIGRQGLGQPQPRKTSSDWARSAGDCAFDSFGLEQRLCIYHHIVFNLFYLAV